MSSFKERERQRERSCDCRAGTDLSDACSASTPSAEETEAQWPWLQSWAGERQSEPSPCRRLGALPPEPGTPTPSPERSELTEPKPSPCHRDQLWPALTGVLARPLQPPAHSRLCTHILAPTPALRPHRPESHLLGGTSGSLVRSPVHPPGTGLMPEPSDQGRVRARQTWAHLRASCVGGPSASSWRALLGKGSGKGQEGAGQRGRAGPSGTESWAWPPRGTRHPFLWKSSQPLP